MDPADPVDSERARPDWRDLTPRQQDALVRNTVVLLGAPADLAVAVVRRVRGRRGAHLGPTVASLVLAVLAPRVARWALRTGGRPGAATLLGLGVSVVVGPAIAGSGRGAVVGSGSPLWSCAVAAGVRMLSAAVAVVPVALAAGRRRREQPVTGA